MEHTIGVRERPSACACMLPTSASTRAPAARRAGRSRSRSRRTSRSACTSVGGQRHDGSSRTADRCPRVPRRCSVSSRAARACSSSRTGATCAPSTASSVPRRCPPPAGTSLASSSTTRAGRSSPSRTSAPPPRDFSDRRRARAFEVVRAPGPLALESDSADDGPRVWKDWMRAMLCRRSCARGC